MFQKKIAIGFVSLALLGAGIAGVSQAQDASPRPDAPAAAPDRDGRGPGGPGGGPRGGDFRGGRHGGPDRDGGHFRGGPRGRGGVEASKHIEGRIAFLKAELKITDAQSRSWDQYASFMRENAKARDAAQAKAKAEMETKRAERPAPGQPRERKPLLDRINDQESRLETMLQATQKRKAATAALYKALNDEQKKLAEDLM